MAHFEFDPFSVHSLLVQAVNHVMNEARLEMINEQTLALMSQKLNEIIGVALQPYDSPPAYPWDFNFKFDSLRKDDYQVMRVINKAGEVVLEWEN